MKKMSAFASTLALLGACVVALFSSCGTQPAFDSLVPANAIVVVKAANPEAFFKGVEEAIDGLGYKGLLGGKTLTQLVDETGSLKGFDITTADIDFSKPMGMYMVKAEGQDMPGAVLLLPIKGGKATFDRIAASVGEGYASLQGDYAIVGGSGYKPAYPIAKGKDLSFAPKVADGLVMVYVDVKTVRKDYAGEFEAMKARIGDSFADGNPSQAAMAENYLKMYYDLFDQADALALSFDVGKEGIAVDCSLACDPAKGIALALKDLPAGSRVMDGMRVVPSASLASFAWDMDMKAVYDFFVPLMIDTYKSLSIPDDVLARLKTLMDRSMAAIGGRGSYGFDMSLDAEALAEERYADGLGMKLSSVVELKDEAAFKDYLKSMEKGGEMATTLDALLAPYGMGIELVATEKNSGGVDYSSYLFKVAVSPTDTNEVSAEEAASVQQLFDSFFGKYPLNVAVKDKKAYMSMGDEAELLALVSGGTIAGNAADSDGAKSFASILPSEANVVGMLNVNRIVQLASGASTGSDAPAAGVSPTGLYFYGQFSAGKIKGGLFFPTEAILGLTPILFNLFGSL